MHEKYVFLHFSYSAPVLVPDVVPDSDAVRAETILLRLFFCIVVRFVTDWRCGVFVRETVFVAVRELTLFFAFCIGAVLERGTNMDVRPVVARCVVVVNRPWVGGVFLSDFARDIDVPSRTAALAMPIHTKVFVIIDRIFFISDKILANL